MLIHMDGFDVYASNADLAFQYNQINIGLSTNSGRFGQGCIYTTFYNNQLQKIFTSQYTDIWTGFALNTYGNGGLGVNGGSSFQNYSGDATVCMFQSTSGIEFIVTYNNLTSAWTGYIYTGTASSIVAAQGIYTLTSLNWHWIDIHYVPNVSSGKFELLVDGVQVISLTGIRTAYNSSNFIAMFLGGSPQNGPINGDWDDWYILDNLTGPFNYGGPLGDSRIYTLVPNRDVPGFNDGVPLFGSSYYPMVDEPQNDGLTTYINIPGVAGNINLFGMTTLPVDAQTIFGTKVQNIVEQTAGGVLYGNAVIVSNGVEAEGPSQAIQSTFFSQNAIFESDPSTGNVWTYSNVNIAECGFKVVSGP